MNMIEVLPFNLLYQGGPFETTNQFLYNFYYGFGGLGTWVVFFILAAAAVLWLQYDSQNRRLPVNAWKMGVILTACLLLPAVLFRFTVTETNVDDYYTYRQQIAELEETREPANWRDLVEGLERQINDLPPLVGSQELLAYLGMLGGLLAPAVAVGYYVSYKGLVGCGKGHVYEQNFGQCPDCAREMMGNEPVRAFAEERRKSGSPEPVEPMAPARAKTHAWLVDDQGKTYQLCQGTSTIGRSSRCDVRIIGDTTLSREHAKIVEQNNHYKIIDLGSQNGTRVNGRRLKEPMLLEPDDEIILGDETRLRFTTIRH